jgi:hypothetical protein
MSEIIGTRVNKKVMHEAQSTNGIQSRISVCPPLKIQPKAHHLGKKSWPDPVFCYWLDSKGLERHI